MSELLKNKVAIVTGGTRGIGYAIVRKYVQEGFDMFEEMNARISREITFFLLKVRIRKEPKNPALEKAKEMAKRRIKKA